MALINNVELSPSTAKTGTTVFIAVSVTWPAITHDEMAGELHNDYAVNLYDDFKGGVV